MKRSILAISMMLIGVIGLLGLVIPCCCYLNAVHGTVDGSTSFYVYLDYFGLLPLFVVFCAIAALGLIASIIEYFTK